MQSRPGKRKILHKAAVLGDAYAIYNLGYCYEYGNGVEQSISEKL